MLHCGAGTAGIGHCLLMVDKFLEIHAIITAVGQFRLKIRKFAGSGSWRGLSKPFLDGGGQAGRLISDTI